MENPSLLAQMCTKFSAGRGGDASRSVRTLLFPRGLTLLVALMAGGNTLRLQAANPVVEPAGTTIVSNELSRSAAAHLQHLVSQLPVVLPTNDLPAAPAGTNLSQSSSVQLDDKMTIGVGDRLSFRIIEDRDEPKMLLVTDSGQLEVPYIWANCRQGKDLPRTGVRN